MSAKIIILVLVASQLCACVVTPRIEIAERLTFDAPPPSQMPLSYNDLLCCYDCTA